MLSRLSSRVVCGRTVVGRSIPAATSSSRHGVRSISTHLTLSHQSAARSVNVNRVRPEPIADGRSSSSSHSSSNSNGIPIARGQWSILIAGGAVIGIAYVLMPYDTVSAAAATPLEEARRIAASETAAKPPKGGWPVYTAEEIAKHATPEQRIWVSFRDSVYDITDFIALHPGGASKVMLGAGGAIDPFWALYRQHDNEAVRTLLAQYRIGTLAGYDAAASAQSLIDPYADDPKRHKALRVSNPKPFNAEPPLDILGEAYITPNELFFVRNHLPVPHIDESEYRLVVGGEGLVEKTYTLDELRTQFPKHSVTATLQCAGNRRSEMNLVKKVKGLDWGGGAISNAEWTGVRLKDVLKRHGLNTEAPQTQNIKHVHFDGLDSDVTGMTYSASIPIEKVVDGSSDVLLAYEMNGTALPLDHGYPLRAVVPGVVGARNVKWLGRVETSAVESSGHWQQNDYKGFSPNIDWNNVDFSMSPAIQELPVTSAITEPAAGSVVKKDADTIKVKGYAWSGGGRGIVRVDVSADGVNWHTARLSPKPASEPQSLYRSWAWTPWSIDLPRSALTGDEATLMCKAVDASYNNQPESYAPIWNLRGCLSNAWHKVLIKVEGPTKSEKN